MVVKGDRHVSEYGPDLTYFPSWQRVSSCLARIIESFLTAAPRPIPQHGHTPASQPLPHTRISLTHIMSHFPTLHFTLGLALEGLVLVWRWTNLHRI